MSPLRLSPACRVSIETICLPTHPQRRTPTPVPHAKSEHRPARRLALEATVRL